MSQLRGRIFKAYQLTSGVQFNQWKVLLVTQGSTNRTRTIAVTVVPEIVLADINLFSDYMFQLSNTRIQVWYDETQRHSEVQWSNWTLPVKCYAQ